MKKTINAENQSIGRVATQAANLLRGKDSPEYAPHIIPTNKVVITNAKNVKITGNKLGAKLYHRHSGYPGGIKTLSLQEMIDKKGVAEAIRKAVYGMLPDNKLRSIMMNNLSIEE